jgi:hypothetical protein
MRTKPQVISFADFYSKLVRNKDREKQAEQYLHARNTRNTDEIISWIQGLTFSFFVRKKISDYHLVFDEVTLYISMDIGEGKDIPNYCYIRVRHGNDLVLATVFEMVNKTENEKMFKPGKTTVHCPEKLRASFCELEYSLAKEIYAVI